MARNRQSAKAAGASFERAAADYLRDNGCGDFIDRRVKTGAKDRGDIGGFRLSPALRGGKVVIECKNVAPPKVAPSRVELAAIVASTATPTAADFAIADAVRAAYRPALAQRLSLGPWLNEAAVERGNDDAVAGVVMFKRHGVGNVGRQIVAMEVDDFIALRTGERPAADQ